MRTYNYPNNGLKSLFTEYGVLGTVRYVRYFAWRDLGFQFRYLYYRFFQNSYFEYLGKNVKIGKRVDFRYPNQSLRIGTNTSIGNNCEIQTSPGAITRIGNNVSLNTGCIIVSCFSISIGDDTRVGEYVSIRDQNHIFSNDSIPYRKQGLNGGNVNIGQNCWIGRGVVILPGVIIGSGTIIAANSVVNKNLPARCVAGGVPAKILKRL